MSNPVAAINVKETETVFDISDSSGSNSGKWKKHHTLSS